MPTTTAEQTFVDLAGCLDLVDLVVLGDSLIRHGRTTPEQLISMTDSSSVRGAVRARKAARLVRVEVDSAYETRLRLLIMFAGLPEPVINYCILDGQGRTARRFDLSYPHLMLAIEYDGRDHIDRESQWRNDITRREELESAGWRFMVITGADLLQHPEHVLRRITGAVQAAGASHLA